jgi:hypothetical protein
VIKLTPELIRKHKDLIEVRVKQHQSRSKKGKVFTVKAHERDVRKMSVVQLKAEIDKGGKLADVAKVELRSRNIGNMLPDARRIASASDAALRRWSKGHLTTIKKLANKELDKRAGLDVGKKRKSYDKNTGRLKGNPGSEYERPYSTNGKNKLYKSPKHKMEWMTYKRG